MKNEEAIQFRKEIDECEFKIKELREKLKETKNNDDRNKIKNEIKELEEKIDKTYEKIFKEFGDNIATQSVEILNDQSILFSEFFGRYLFRNDLSTSQIRNVYGEVMRLKMKGFNSNELVLLKPRLAYSTERKGTDGSRKFRDVIEKALDKVIFAKEKQEELFQNFANFFEAILAYHRSFGGK